jgi:hypothetical protein
MSAMCRKDGEKDCDERKVRWKEVLGMYELPELQGHQEYLKPCCPSASGRSETNTKTLTEGLLHIA